MYYRKIQSFLVDNLPRMHLIHKVSSNYTVFPIHQSWTVSKASEYLPLNSTFYISEVLTWGIMDRWVTNRLYGVFDSLCV